MTWSIKPESRDSIKLNYSQKTFLYSLALRLPFDIVVTDGSRTPLQQITAMYRKISRGENIVSLYKDTQQVIEIVNAYPNKSIGVDIIKRYQKQGRRISRHLDEQAFDLRSKDKTPEQIQQIMSAAWAAGATNVIKEGDHLHLSVPKLAITRINQNALSFVPSWVWYVSVPLLISSGVFLYIQKNKKKKRKKRKKR